MQVCGDDLMSSDVFYSDVPYIRRIRDRCSCELGNGLPHAHLPQVPPINQAGHGDWDDGAEWAVHSMLAGWI